MLGLNESIFAGEWSLCAVIGYEFIPGEFCDSSMRFAVLRLATKGWEGGVSAGPRFLDKATEVE